MQGRVEFTHSAANFSSCLKKVDDGLKVWLSRAPWRTNCQFSFRSQLWSTSHGVLRWQINDGEQYLPEAEVRRVDMAKTRTPFVFDTVLEEVYIFVLRNFDIEQLVIAVARNEAS